MTRTLTRSVTLALALGSSLWALPALAQDAQPPYQSGPQGGPTNASDESQDSGLGLEWVYLNADVGFDYVNMTSFSQSQLGLTSTAGGGPTFGLGAGVRLLFLSAGVRVRDTLLDALGSLWTIDAEAALHMRIWRIDPYFGVRGGYAFVGSLDSGSFQSAVGTTQPSVSVHGFDVGPMLGIDFYFSSLVSIGAEGTATFLFLSRPKAAIPDLSQLPPAQQMMAMQQIANSPLYQASGSSVGVGGGATAHLGIHF